MKPIVVVLSVVAISCIVFRCKKQDDPRAVSGNATEITPVSALITSSAWGDKLLERGVCWSTKNAEPTIKDNKMAAGSDEGMYQLTISPLQSGTMYYYRAYCASRLEINYGNTQVFNTTDQTVIYDFSLKPRSEKSIIATMSVDKLNETVKEIGVCLSTHTLPTVADATFSIELRVGESTVIPTVLLPNTIYYCRPYLTASNGVTTYGDEKAIKTYKDIVQDIDGNSYYTIAIGNQEWLASNLIVTKFRNGDPLKSTTLSSWFFYAAPKYGYYEESFETAKNSGALYSKNCVLDPRKIAPIGWRVPTFFDWEILATTLSLTDTSHAAIRTNLFADGTNESGFSMTGTGYRYANEDRYIDYWAGHWVTDQQLENSILKQGYWSVSTRTAGGLLEMGRQFEGSDYGMAIRCIKQ